MTEQNNNVVNFPIAEMREAPPKARELPHLQACMEAGRLAHEVIRGYREALGDASCPPWDETEPEERQAAAHRVIEVLKKRHLTMHEMHAEWCDYMREQGWMPGEFDAEKKTHHMLVDFDQLPEASRVEDAIFRNTVLALFY